MKDKTDIDKIPPRVRKDVVDYLIANTGWIKSEADALIEMRSHGPTSIFDMYLSWNGVQGYSSDFYAAAIALHNAEVKS